MSIHNNLFRLTFPDAWKETTVYTFEGPNDSGIQHNLVLTVLPELPPDTGIKEFAKSLTETSAAVLPGFQMIGEQEIRFFAESPGYEIKYSYRPSDEIEYVQKQWYFSLKNNVYLFTGTFNTKTIKTIGLDVEKIIRTLRTDLVTRGFDDEDE